jgi:hypothetical protein
MVERRGEEAAPGANLARTSWVRRELARLVATESEEPVGVVADGDGDTAAIDVGLEFAHLGVEPSSASLQLASEVRVGWECGLPAQ